MKILVLGDIHYGFRTNKSKYLDVTDEVMAKATSLCIEKNIENIVILGDYFENRNALNVKTMNRGFLALNNLIKETGCPVYFLKGNHDYYYRTTKEYSSADPLTFIDPKIKVISEITPIEFDGIKTLMVPWLMPGDVPKFLEIKEEDDYQVCFGHFEVVGFDLNVFGFTNKSGFKVKDFSNFKKVFSGHFHKRQKSRNVRYVGSPYQLDFAEAGDTKGFTILEIPSLKETFTENKFSPRYVKAWYSNRDETKRKNINNNVVQPIVDLDVPDSDIIGWEAMLRDWNPKELLSTTYALPDERKDIDLEPLSEIPSDPIQLLLTYMETLNIPEDIKKGTLKKLVQGLFEETQRAEQLTRKNNHITIDKVEFQNFYSFGNRWHELELRKGINLVMGVNGSGKTALLESIVVGLYGRPVRNLTKEGVINKVNKDNCNIKVHFRDGRTTWHFERCMRPHTIQINRGENIKPEPQIADLRQYQNELERNILSCNYPIFSNLQFVSLNKTRPFLSLGKTDKRVFLENLLDLTVFQWMNWIIGDKLKIFDKKLAVFEKEESIYKESVEENRDHYRKLRRTFDQIKTGREDRLKKLEDTITLIQKKLQKLEEKRTEVEKWLNLGEEDRVDLIQDTRALVKDIIKLDTKISDEEVHIDDIKKSKECHWCFRPITDTEVEKKCIQRLIQIIKDLKDQQLKITKQKEKLDSKEEKLLEQLKKQKELFQEIDQQIGILKDRKKNCQEQIDDLKVFGSVDELKQRLKDIREQIYNTLAKKRDVKEKKELFRKYIRYFAYIRTLIGDDQVKKFAIAKIRPWLNQIANDYLSKVGADYRIYFDEQLQEQFKLRNREEFEYENFSGGEKRRLDLILIFTFQDILEKLRGYWCDFLVFDEFLDSNLDPEGRQAIMDIIKARQKSRNLKVYVVTHSTDISAEDFTGFYKVSKDDHFSQLTEGEFVNGI